ncbi:MULTISPECIES: hypothetical protein [Acutalibacteraceae]|uniref:hypothetical protein n=1 Tax=Acutalibacteraceae TaxID=3082771 RepID=UPI0013E8B2CF|nr:MULTISPECIES: hypothetical protein [Acutalibacteraceae]
MKIIVVKLEFNPEKYAVVQQIMKPPRCQKRETGDVPDAEDSMILNRFQGVGSAFI